MNRIHFVNGRRFFFGFILILIGLLMILQRSGIIGWEFYDFLMSWKMLLVAIGVFVFLGGNRGAGIILVSLGTFFMIPEVFEDYRRYFWPAVLVVLGVTFLLGSRARRIKAFNAKKGMFGNTEGSFTMSEATIDYFDEFVIFGGRDINLSTLNLLGGKSTAIFGGIEIDLRQCQLSDQGTTIDVTSIFGGNVIKVPNDWTVINRVTAIFGGYSDVRIKDSGYSPNPAKTIIVRGSCIFGGTEIRNREK